MSTKYNSSGSWKYWTSPDCSVSYEPYRIGDGDTGTNSRIPAQPVVYFYQDFLLDNLFVIDSFRFYNTAYGYHPSNIDILGGLSDGAGNISWTSIATNVNIPSNSGWQTVSFSNTTQYRYYQLKVNAIRTPTNTSTRMYEWELYGPDGQTATTAFIKGNSPASTYTAGSSYFERPASNAGDGDYATFWRSNSVTTEWFKTDLGAGNAKAITRVTMDCRAYAYLPTGFTIHGSNNDSSWTLLKTISTTPIPSLLRGEWEFFITGDVAYRYIKITFTGSTGGSVAITEFGLWTDAVTIEWEKLAYHEDSLAKSLFDAQTVVGAVSDNTPVAVALAEQRILGRKTGGNITALTAEEVLTILGATPAADWLENQVFS